MLTKRKKTAVIKEAAIHAADTGSPEVQIAVLSKKIDELATHAGVAQKSAGRGFADHRRWTGAPIWKAADFLRESRRHRARLPGTSMIESCVVCRRKIACG